MHISKNFDPILANIINKYIANKTKEYEDEEKKLADSVGDFTNRIIYYKVCPLVLYAMHRSNKRFARVCENTDRVVLCRRRIKSISCA